MVTNGLKEKLEQHLSIITPEVCDSKTEIVNADVIDDVAISFVPSFEISFAEAQQRLAMLQRFVKEMLIPGQDFGMIPKCDKPCLFKAGAEKLCDIYGFSKRVEILNRIEDWQAGILSYEVKMVLISKRSGIIEAEGLGCCNSKERKYATQDPYTLANTILKMAKKRAFVDAVLSATRSSGIFSQDVEDMDNTAPESKETAQSKPASADNARSFQPDKKLNTDYPVTPNQLRKIMSLVSEKRIPVNKVSLIISDRYDVCESKKLSLRQASDFIQYLITYKAG